MEPRKSRTMSIAKTNPITLDDFSLLKVLGKGAFGKVFLARKKATKQLFALKVAEKPRIEMEINHQKDEIRILENMNSRFICQLFHRFETQQNVYMVLELLSGGELYSYLSREKTLTEEDTRYYIAQVALALEHLHNHHVVYRDLKATNVMLDRHGHIKIIDFGLSKFNFKKGEKTSSFCGTYEAMSPEMMCRVPYDHSVDVWALGILMYDMLFGGPPYKGTTREEWAEKILTEEIKYPRMVTKNCKTVINSLLTRNAKKRITLEKLKTRAFFRPIDWIKLEEGQFDLPPFRPELRGDDDVSQFDKCFTDLPPIESPRKNVRNGDDGDAFEGFDGNDWFTDDWNSGPSTSN